MSNTEKKDSDEGLCDFFNCKNDDKTDANLLNIEIDVQENCFFQGGPPDHPRSR